MLRTIDRMLGAGVFKFLVRRILISIPVLIGIIFVTFIMIRAVPGGPFDFVGSKKRSAESLAALKARYGLDMPLLLNLPGNSTPLVNNFRALPDCELLRQGVTREQQNAKAFTETYEGWHILRIVTERKESSVVVKGRAQNCYESRSVLYSDLFRSQFFSYLFNAMRLDFGPSLDPKLLGRPVGEIIAERLPASMRLGFLAAIIGFALGIPLGVLAALRRNTSLDYGITFFASVLDAIPTLVLGPLLIRFFVLTVNALPGPKPQPWTTDNIFDGEFFKYAILPVMVIAIGIAAGLARLTRTSLLQVLRDDYIRTARAKGLRERGVLYIHALKNAMIPVATIIGPLLAGLLTGSLIIERIFAIPGIGGAFVTSIESRDYNMLVGVTILFSVFLILGNLLVDVMYTWLDPRIRFD